MDELEAQATWTEYYQRIRVRRQEEARLLWSRVRDAGLAGRGVAAVNFTHFSRVRENAEALASQLSENYRMEIVAAGEDGYWYVRGTTELAGGLVLSGTDHLSWVEFMADVSESHGCVFSTWSIEMMGEIRRFESEAV